MSAKQSKPKGTISFKSIGFIVTIAIAVGLGIGIELYLHRHAIKNEVTPPKKLEVLSIKNLLTPDFLNQFRKRSGITVNLTEAANPEEIWDKMQSQPFDVVSVFSYQMRLAVQTARLQQIDNRKVQQIANLSPDFLESSRDITRLWSLPISWGVDEMLYNSQKVSPPMSWLEALKPAKGKPKVGLAASTADLDWLLSLMFPSGTANVTKQNASALELTRNLKVLLDQSDISRDFLDPIDLVEGARANNILMLSCGRSAFAPFNSEWKLTLPSEGGLLWTLDFALPKNAANVDSAYEFLSEAMRPENATIFVNALKEASTNRRLESVAMDARLKPSYLRQIPLNKIVSWKESAHDGELRNALRAAQPLAQ